ncbi:MAG: hypothetical protein AAGJ35_03435 [Myxococcota bacterium]
MSETLSTKVIIVRFVLGAVGSLGSITGTYLVYRLLSKPKDTVQVQVNNQIKGTAPPKRQNNRLAPREVDDLQPAKNDPFAGLDTKDKPFPRSPHKYTLRKPEQIDWPGKSSDVCKEYLKACYRSCVKKQFVDTTPQKREQSCVRSCWKARLQGQAKELCAAPNHRGYDNSGH